MSALLDVTELGILDDVPRVVVAVGVAEVEPAPSDQDVVVREPNEVDERFEVDVGDGIVLTSRLPGHGDSVPAFVGSSVAVPSSSVPVSVSPSAGALPAIRAACSISSCARSI